MNVYFKNLSTGKLGLTVVNLEDTEDHSDAILKVKEDLVASGIGYDGGVLALFQGGKK